MSEPIICPNCSNKIEISEAMSAQLAATIRRELETEFAQKARKLSVEREKLAELGEQLKASQEEIEQQIKNAVEKQRKEIATKARTEAEQAVAIEIADRNQELKETQEKLKLACDHELKLRKKQRELQTQAEQQELEITRRIDQERQQIRKQATQLVQEQNELKQAEKDQMIEGLRKQIDELKFRVDQGSQQIQGEVQEVALENLLANVFPNDAIEPVAKGVRGADVIQRVFDHHGHDCGAILWESKRTKNWSNKWLSKAIDDQQEAKAACACIVTAAMPEAVEYFGAVNGVWVTSWKCARSAAIALRCMLIEVAQSRLASEGQHDKMELVYNYLSGSEFRNRIRGLVEPYIEMQTDLEAEKRAFNRHWNKRQKQLDRALASTTGLYGDLQGIIGSSLQEIEGIDTLTLELEDVPDSVTSPWQATASPKPIPPPSSSG